VAVGCRESRDQYPDGRLYRSGPCLAPRYAPRQTGVWSL